MKVFDYIITFKNNGYKTVDRISQLMLLLAVLVFAYALSANPLSKGSVLPLVIIVGIIGWWVYCYMRQKNGHIPYFRFALLLAACGWYLQPNGLLISAVYLLAAILEKQVKFPQEVAFDADEIVFNSFPKKSYQWSDLQNVVLKDNVLTIDFRNNKLIQKETDAPVSYSIETEFNGFCANMLNAESLMPNA